MNDNMISLEEMREIEPALKNVSDKELIEARRVLYQLAKLSLECFIEKKTDKEAMVEIPYFTPPIEKVIKRSPELERIKNHFANKICKAMEEYIGDKKTLEEKIRVELADTGL